MTMYLYCATKYAAFDNGSLECAKISAEFTQSSYEFDDILVHGIIPKVANFAMCYHAKLQV